MLMIFFWFFGSISYNILIKPNLGKVEVDKRSIMEKSTSIIENHVYQANLRCPIEIPLGKITYLSVEDSFVVYNLVTTLNRNNYNYYSHKHGRFTELGLYVNSYGKSSYSDKYIDALTDNGYGIKFRAITDKHDSLNIISITAQDLLITKAYVDRFPEEAINEYISLFVCLENRHLPMDIGDGMILSSIIKEEQHFVYRLILDKNYSIEHLRNIKGNLKKEILNNITTFPEYKTMLQTCNLAKHGIKHRLIVKHQNDSIDFQFNYIELQKKL